MQKIPQKKTLELNRLLSPSGKRKVKTREYNFPFKEVNLVMNNTRFHNKSYSKHI